MFDELKNLDSKKFNYIPLSEAGKVLNTSRDYMNVLVRRGKLRAIKLGRNWVTTNEWLLEYQKSVGKLAAPIETRFQEVSEVGLHRQADSEGIEADEKVELNNLKTKLIFEKELFDRLAVIETKLGRDDGIKLSGSFKTEREKSLAFQNLISASEIKLAPRPLKDEERISILDSVNERLKHGDTRAFEKAARQFGILKTWRRRFDLKLGAAAGLALVLLAATFAFSGFSVSKFKDLSILTFKNLNISKYQAAIFSGVFKNFPEDVPDFYQWISKTASETVSDSLAFLKLKKPSELAVGELPEGESKLAKPQETFARIGTFEEALALDLGVAAPGMASDIEKGA